MGTLPVRIRHVCEIELWPRASLRTEWVARAAREMRAPAARVRTYSRLIRRARKARPRATVQLPMWVEAVTVAVRACALAVLTATALSVSAVMRARAWAAAGTTI